MIDYKQYLFGALKYFAAVGMLLGTLLMLHPQIAALSPLPWFIFTFANLIWAWDSIRLKNRAWASVSLIFIVLDIGLFLSRLYPEKAFKVMAYLYFIWVFKIHQW